MALRTRNNHSKYNISNDVEKIKAALFDTSHDLKGKAGEILTDSVNNVKHRSSQMRNGVVGYTKEKPFKALGFAVLAGIAIGWLIKK